MSNLAVPAGLRVTSVILLTHATCPHFKLGTTVSGYSHPSPKPSGWRVEG